MRKTDPEKHGTKHRQILAAAATCFANKGFHRTSTAEISAAAGMSSGNIFHYFPTKQAIIEAIIEEEGRKTAAYFAQTGDRGDLFAAILEVMDIILETAGDPARLALELEIAAEATRNEAIGALTARNDAALQDGLASLLRGAAARNQIDRTLDPADLTLWLVTIIDGIFSRAAVDPQFKPQQQRRNLRLLISRYLRPDAAFAG